MGILGAVVFAMELSYFVSMYLIVSMSPLEWEVNKPLERSVRVTRSMHPPL
jgi:hypothetical protein